MRKQATDSVARTKYGLYYRTNGATGCYQTDTWLIVRRCRKAWRNIAPRGSARRGTWRVNEGTSRLLAALRHLQSQAPDNGAFAEHLAYQEKRQKRPRYPKFIAQGWPIGSSIVESATKLWWRHA